MMFFCQLLSLKTSLLSGALTLVIMILPTIVRTTQESSRRCPRATARGRWASGRPSGI